jgi:segregation and condensation protein B
MLLDTRSNLQSDLSLLDQDIAAAIESLLFVAGRALERAELCKLLSCKAEQVDIALQVLENDLRQQKRGIRLQRQGDSIQLVTAPESAKYVAAFLGLPMTTKLTSAALETLSVLAYRQPLTRAQLEAIRGVNSDRALASLLQHGLVEEIGRAPTIGRPALFATTADFLQQFGLTTLEELPGIVLAPLEKQQEPT